MQVVDQRSRTALVTGCSSGIGRQAALQLRQADLVANAVWAGDGADGPYAGFRKDLARWHAHTSAGSRHSIAGRLAVSAADVARVITRAATSRRPRPRYPWASWPAACSCCAAGCLPAAFDAFVRSQFPFPDPQTDPDRPRPQGARK